MKGFDPCSRGRGVGRRLRRGGKRTLKQRKRESIGTHSPVHRRGLKACDGKAVYLYYCEACKATSTAGKFRKTPCHKAPPELKGRSVDDDVA